MRQTKPNPRLDDSEGYAPKRGSIAEFRGATKLFGEVVAADSIDLTIFKGEFLSFLGPSGCGKTTALRMLAGFETPTRGDVLIDGDRVNDVPPHQRPEIGRASCRERV